MLSDKKIVVAGHICLDITPAFPQENLGLDNNANTKCAEPEGGFTPSNFYRPGKLLGMDGVNVHTGGSVANTGLALHTLGADVRLIGKIGNDEFGKLIINILEKYRVDGINDMIISPKVPTSYSVILAPPGMDRMFLHCAGANDSFSTSDIDYSRIRDAALFHFGYPPLMRHMYENDGDELARLFQDVKSLGVATSLDMACFDSDSLARKTDWKFILKRVIPYVDFFLPSAEELCMMIDPDRYNEWSERAAGGDICECLNVIEDVKPLADKLIESYHAKVVVIKCGCQGLYYKTGSYNDLSDIGANASINLANWAEKEEWIKAFRPAVIRSATGAGDAAIAAFLATALEGMPIRECARFAAAEGACCLEGLDSLSTLRTIPELQKMYLMGYM